MGRISDQDTHNALDVRFGGAAVDVPATWYLGLSSTRPVNDGTNITEPLAADGYARVAIANTAANWPAAAGRRKSLGVKVTMPRATASWGLLPYAVLMTAATGGRMGAWADAGQLVVDANVEAVLPAGSLTLNSAG